MYLPSSHNPKFTNRMLISKINSPRTMNMSFKEIEKAKIKIICNKLKIKIIIRIRINKLGLI